MPPPPVARGLAADHFDCELACEIRARYARDRARYAPWLGLARARAEMAYAGVACAEMAYADARAVGVPFE